MLITKNIELLLKGKILLKEIEPESNKFRTWIEILLQDDLQPAYPMRTEPYAMLGHSKYQNTCNPDKARFKVRVASFLVSDIENDFDPSYDWVSDFQHINSTEELKDYLKKYNLNIEDFSDASFDDEYPL